MARGRFDGKALTDARELFVADNWNTGNPHFGGKLAFGRDGMLYMTVGERGDCNRAQNTALHGGKSLRLSEDGAAAPGNPFAGREGFKPEIYTYGHRNPQALAFHPDTVTSGRRNTARKAATSSTRSSGEELRLADRDVRPRAHRRVRDSARRRARVSNRR